MRLLYAEDEQMLSMAITEILQMEGHQVDPVYDGAQALEHLKQHSYDAVVLDIMMPKADGIQVLAEMRRLGDYTPVLLLTAKAQVEDRIAGLSAGADDYLGKPFSAGELVARLSALVRRDTRYQNPVRTLGNVTLDCATGALQTQVSSLRLSPKETALLALLMQQQAALPASELQQKLWAEGADPQIVPLYISYLQHKLAQLHASITIGQQGDAYVLKEVTRHETAAV